ncbi:sensor histidine kinase [Aurantiacibacter xanthus]|nr:HAMP domain-containing sensor histidine kinase [Aurantiacibacter xanthus]
MRAYRWLQSWSLRGRLSATALAGLATSVVLTVLLYLTASWANDVVITAQRTHEQVRVYSLLQDAARGYQVASYARVNQPESTSQKSVDEARMRVEELLTEVEQLPKADAREQSVNQLIIVQGRALVEHFRDPAALIARVARVDEIYRSLGSQPAIREVARITRPVVSLQETLNGEIKRGNGAVASATRHAQSLISAAIYASVGGIVLALLFSLTVQYLLQARLGPALRRLEEGVVAFGKGDLQHRVGLSGRDEFARLSHAFDSMAATIAEKQEALRQIQLGLERAVAERTEELEQANAQLAAADERRRAFLADVSHELRTPLTIIRGEAQVALRTCDRSWIEPQEAFDRILQQTHDLSRMVDELLLIAVAEAGHLPLEREVLDLRELGAQVALDFETLVSEMGGSIRSVPGRAILAYGDHDRIRRALAALIENSLRHSPAGVDITVEAFATPDHVAICVRDTGPGLDFAQANRLFERFHRGETRGEGSGLGLSLVKALVLAHGGHTALAPHPAGGTVATLYFPLPALDKVAA